MLLGVFSFQWSVSATADQPKGRFSGKRSQTGDGNGSVRLLCAARERGPLRWWTGETRPGRRRDAGSGWYFSCCRRYEFCFFWYEFCSFLYEFVFFLHVLCCMFGNDPRYSAKKRVFGGRKTAILWAVGRRRRREKWEIVKLCAPKSGGWSEAGA